MKASLRRGSVVTVLVLVLGAGCRKEPAAPPPGDDHPPPPTNRIDVPEAVRRNLGVTFAKVERRRVATTLRVPGQFELLPAARRDYRSSLVGRVEVLAEPLQSVARGDLLYRVDSPDWRDQQRQLAEQQTAIGLSQARIESMQALQKAHEAHEASLEAAAAEMAERVRALEAVREHAGVAAELAAARVALAQGRAAIAEAAEKEAETRAAMAAESAALAAARERFELLLGAAAALVGLDGTALTAEAEGLPAWRRLGRIEVRADAAGTVDRLPVANGGWLAVGDLVVGTVDLTQLRFRARGLQSDLALLREGLPAAVVEPRLVAGGGPAMTGPLQLGVEADPQQRTVDLFVRPVELAAWARPGVSALLEVETAAGARPELAIPKAAVLQDGLERVFFRRDPKNADRVIRLVADLGLDDGRFVEVLSGLRAGDEVVLDGAYELMLASSGSAPKGGHFHADGTWHADGK